MYVGQASSNQFQDTFPDDLEGTDLDLVNLCPIDNELDKIRKAHSKESSSNNANIKASLDIAYYLLVQEIRKDLAPCKDPDPLRDFALRKDFVPRHVLAPRIVLTLRLAEIFSWLGQICYAETVIYKKRGKYEKYVNNLELSKQILLLAFDLYLYTTQVNSVLSVNFSFKYADSLNELIYFLEAELNPQEETQEPEYPLSKVEKDIERLNPDVLSERVWTIELEESDQLSYVSVLRGLNEIFCCQIEEAEYERDIIEEVEYEKNKVEQVKYLKNMQKILLNAALQILQLHPKTMEKREELFGLRFHDLSNYYDEQELREDNDVQLMQLADGDWYKLMIIHEKIVSEEPEGSSRQIESEELMSKCRSNLIQEHQNEVRLATKNNCLVAQIQKNDLYKVWAILQQQKKIVDKVLGHDLRAEDFGVDEEIFVGIDENYSKIKRVISCKTPVEADHCPMFLRRKLEFQELHDQCYSLSKAITNLQKTNREIQRRTVISERFMEKMEEFNNNQIEIELKAQKYKEIIKKMKEITKKDKNFSVRNYRRHIKNLMKTEEDGCLI
jgi:hypothetical protein